jgi:hypothetical protein
MRLCGTIYYSLAAVHVSSDISINLIFMFPRIMIFYTKMTNKMQLCRTIYYSLAALHVSSDIFTHHQEHLNCITVSGITHTYVAAKWQ